MLEGLAEVGRQEVTSAIGVVVDARADETAVDAAVSILMRRLELDARHRPAGSGDRRSARPPSSRRLIPPPPACSRRRHVDRGDSRGRHRHRIQQRLASGCHRVAHRLVQELITAAVEATARAFPGQFARLRIDAALIQARWDRSTGADLASAVGSGWRRDRRVPQQCGEVLRCGSQAAERLLPHARFASSCSASPHCSPSAAESM